MSALYWEILLMLETKPQHLWQEMEVIPLFLQWNSKPKRGTILAVTSLFLVL